MQSCFGESFGQSGAQIVDSESQDKLDQVPSSLAAAEKNSIEAIANTNPVKTSSLGGQCQTESSKSEETRASPTKSGSPHFEAWWDAEDVAERHAERQDERHAMLEHLHADFLDEHVAQSPISFQHSEIDLFSQYLTSSENVQGFQGQEAYMPLDWEIDHYEEWPPCNMATGGSADYC